MIGGSQGRGNSLENHIPTLFLAAGVLLIGYAALNGLEAFTDTAVEPNLFQLGYVGGFLGLFGLYPRVASREPWLARAGATAGVLGAIAISAFTVGELAGFVAGSSERLPGQPAFIVMALLGFILGYLAFGAAIIRADVLSRSVGLVLMVPGVIVVLMLAHIAAGWDTLGTAFVISAGQAMAHLAIGATIRAEAEPAGREEVEAEAVSDATAKG